MKKHFQILLLIFIFLNTLACQKASENSPPGIADEKNDIEKATSIDEIKKITEYEIRGLAHPTTIRVSKSSNSYIVSLKTFNDNKTLYKTLIAKRSFDQNSIQETSEAYLFSKEFADKVLQKNVIEAHFESFKKITQLKHIKEIYRCRSSLLWPTLLNHTPDQRGLALLAIGGHMIHLALSWEALLAIDFKTSQAVGFTIKKQKADSHQTYYTSSATHEAEHIWGAEGQTTKSFLMFNIACDESYEKLQPTLSGKGYLASIDQQASFESDSFLKNIFESPKFKLPLKAQSFLDYDDSLVISDLPSWLETYKDYNRPFVQEFYQDALNKIRN